jgi:hypothetical protein
MEQFVLGIFQEQLSKFIIGFRKEQVNANLLNGKGEIRDVNINCAVLNEDLRKMTPFIELESVHVSKLSFHVSSWTNIRKAPILVHVEHLTAIVNEPLDYVDRENRRSIQQITQGEFVEMLRTGVFKARGAYVGIHFGYEDTVILHFISSIDLPGLFLVLSFSESV